MNKMPEIKLFILHKLVYVHHNDTHYILLNNLKKKEKNSHKMWNENGKFLLKFSKCVFGHLNNNLSY